MAGLKSVKLWTIIVTCGLEKRYQRDWLGRVRSVETKAHLRVDASPELVEAYARYTAAISLGSEAAVAAARDALRAGVLALGAKAGRP